MNGTDAGANRWVNRDACSKEHHELHRLGELWESYRFAGRETPTRYQPLRCTRVVGSPETMSHTVHPVDPVHRGHLVGRVDRARKSDDDGVALGPKLVRLPYSEELGEPYVLLSYYAVEYEKPGEAGGIPAAETHAAVYERRTNVDGHPARRPGHDDDAAVPSVPVVPNAPSAHSSHCAQGGLSASVVLIGAQLETTGPDRNYDDGDDNDDVRTDPFQGDRVVAQNVNGVEGFRDELVVVLRMMMVVGVVVTPQSNRPWDPRANQQEDPLVVTRKVTGRYWTSGLKPYA